MRLKSNIFLWLSVATVLPLTILVMAVTVYSEQLYQQQLERETNASLNNIVSEIDRRLYYERQLVLSLANTPTVVEYLPVMARAVYGDLHPEFFERSEKLSQFLSTFQGVVPGFDTLRLLDIEGNTLISVRLGQGSVGGFDGIESFPYAEEELLDERFAQRMRRLPAGELSFVNLPKRRWRLDQPDGPSMLAGIYPLILEGSKVGYLLAEFSGEHIDKILELGPRIRDGKVMVVELNPEQPERNGIILYDAGNEIHFTDSEDRISLQQQINSPDLLATLQKKPYGVYQDDARNLRLYFIEYLPYPNQLVSWVIAAQVDLEALATPFRRIRLGILLMAGFALILSLVVATVGARQIARPVIRLTEGIKRYTSGRRNEPLPAEGADEIRQLVQSFNDMSVTLGRAERERDRAQRMAIQSAKLASIGQMAAGIGHEINNPLNNILTLTKLMRKNLGVDDGSTARDLQSLQEEALRASAIVRGILNFARQIPPHYSEFNVADWVEETLALVRQASYEKHIQFTTRAPADAVISGDRAQLQQVLVNLLLNAIFASDSGGQVDVRVEGDSKAVRIEIIDRGCGIAETDLDKVFDPFFSTKPVGEGSGLGLSISMGIAQRHGGSIELVSNEWGGVTARLTIPQPPPVSPENKYVTEEC